MPSRCRFRKTDGAQCNATAQSGKDLCVFHDPERAEDGRRARRAGGISRTRTAVVLPPETPDHQFRDNRDIAEFLARTMNQVRRGELDARTANTLGFLANILSRVLEQGITEERLARLETRLGIPTDVQPTNLLKGGLVDVIEKPKKTN